ncbi:MAG: putative cytoplasmic protein [Nevskia sp.]|nr:putative cytoplasmic protein [Nevskia sp.]
MPQNFKLPDKKAVIYWPVGTGDSTTLVLRPGELVMQIDLNHLEKADDPDEPSWPIIDHLVKTLPKRNGRPYLAVFALTHPDQDHCRGFAELLKKVDIGELWHTPKVFRAHSKDEPLCPDARVFRNEAHRRRKAILARPSSVPSGDRLRVIGHDAILNEDQYKGLPDTAKSRAGDKVTLVDGVNLAGHFQAFIHAPFSDDQEADKNNTSLALNVVLWEGKTHGQFAFFGDREYPTIKRIFEVTEFNKTNTPYLYWDVMLASHHCSKKVMYWKDEGQKDATLKQDIMDYFEKYARKGAYIVSSSKSDFTDEPGDNPPHRKARKKYEEIVDAGGFVCTHEYPSKKDPAPLVFVVLEQGVKLEDARTKAAVAAGLATAATAARGAGQPPGLQVGFGRKR